MYVTHLMLQLCPIPLAKGSMVPKRINQGLVLYKLYLVLYKYYIRQGFRYGPYGYIF